MHRILVLRGGALGDFIVTLPALATLRAAWPSAHIELAGNASAAALALHRGLLDAVHSQHESRWSALYAPAPLPPAFAAFLARFDLVLNFWPDPEDDLARHLPLHPAQRFLTAPALPTRAPAAAHYCEPLRTLGLNPTTFFHRLAPIHPEATDSPFLALHPGSGSSQKNWPLENWLALLPTLPGSVLIILGDAELSTWSRLTATPLSPGLSRQRIRETDVTLAVSLPLEMLVTLLHRSRHFFGHDSGISHLAAACGVPCTLLFGPTDPAVWSPPAPHVRVVQPFRSATPADLRVRLGS